MRWADDRAADDRDLAMLEMRHDGMRCTQIAREIGCSAKTVRRRTQAIMEADLHLCALRGDPDCPTFTRAQAFYWPEKARPSKKRPKN